jgi:hypothetical protein
MRHGSKLIEKQNACVKNTRYLTNELVLCK